MNTQINTVTFYILDTNIWLDWLIFHNDALDALKAAHQNKYFKIIYTVEMLFELTDVICRSQFKLTQQRQNEVLAELKQLASLVETQSKPLHSIRCKDKDDQIFIDTALAYGSAWLISKDKHLLTLRGKAAKKNLMIGTPLDWQRAQ